MYKKELQDCTLHVYYEGYSSFLENLWDLFSLLVFSPMLCDIFNEFTPSQSFLSSWKEKQYHFINSSVSLCCYCNSIFF